MKTRISVPLDPRVRQKLQEIANREGRSLANLLSRIAQKAAKVDSQAPASAK